ncbi:hypothetical protein INT47_003975 [Mucor saturninus]|uniref:Ion transport domain-containing protein n=1 Tax=Mucor saturninus TaxID=64648 RepID=A0A8H7V525_9FUNG|nr:hypothetical protein INT47_003975 [Mucor saturninus]
MQTDVDRTDQEHLLRSSSPDETREAKNVSRSDEQSMSNTGSNRQQSRYRSNQAWVSLSVLVDERRNDGRLMTNFDEDEPHTPFDAANRNAVAAEGITHDIKRQLYLLMEDPSSSRAAFWANVVVSVLIVFSATMTTVETIPAFRSAESNKVWFHLETVMVSIFSLEYLLRMFAHSDSISMLGNFFISPLSIIDFISIVPFYIELIAKRDTTYEFRYLILRLFRLLRLFKSYKYTNTIVMTIEVMVIAFRRSRDALYALFFFLITCVVLFSTLLYFAERGTWDDNLQTFIDPSGNPSYFDSIPATFWFVIVTITTTGYGDIVPATFIGKLVTFPAMVFGVLLIALPSIIMGRHFTIVWEAMRRRQYHNSNSEVGGMYDK